MKTAPRFNPPKSFSPSSLSQFTTCPLAFRFSYIERREQPPQLAATKGTVVHRALEIHFGRDAAQRTLENAQSDLQSAITEYKVHRDFTELNLNDSEQNKFFNDCEILIDKYFQLENPSQIKPIGLEVKLQAKIGDVVVRGIIDRLELDENGGLVVTDYKTGSVPRANMESGKLGGVHLYALLCQQVFGILPSKVQLLYLSSPASIEATPNESTLRGVKSKSSAIHKAVITACENGDFRPRESVLCNSSGFQDLCPAKGGSLPDDI